MADVAEWLRRWTWNPLGSARTGSNPVVSEGFLCWKDSCENLCDTDPLKNAFEITLIYKICVSTWKGTLGQYGDRTHDIRVISTTL